MESTSVLPFSINSGTNPYVPWTSLDHARTIEELREGGELSENVAQLLTQMLFTQPRNHGASYPGSAPMRSNTAVTFADAPAAQSRPSIEETGINDYDRGNDNRRYGFDLGFMSKILKETFMLKKSDTKRTPSVLTYLQRTSGAISTCNS